MSHKGRVYPVHQLLRMYTNHLTWPYFWPKDYLVWNNVWAGPYEGPMPPDMTEVEGYYLDVSPASHTWQVRGQFENGTADVIECGFVYELQADGKHDWLFPMCWLNGVEQLDRDHPIVDLAGIWSFNTGNVYPLGNATIYPAFDLILTAKPY